MADYQKYLDNYLRNIQPAIDRQMRTQRAQYADRGLLATTAGLGGLAQTQGLLQSDAYLKGNEYAEQARQFDTTFSEGQRQYNQTLAETQARRLAEQALRRGDQVLQAQRDQWAADRDLIALARGTTDKPKRVTYNDTYAKLLSGKPIGDPPETDEEYVSERIPSEEYIYGDLGDLDSAYANAQSQRDRSMADTYGAWRTGEYHALEQKDRIDKATIALQKAAQAAAQRQWEREMAFKREQFNYARERDKQEAGADPYDTLTEMHLGLIDPKTQRNLVTGTQFFNRAVIATGVDVLADARAGNIRAIELVKAYYPKTWREKLAVPKAKPMWIHNLDISSIKDKYKVSPRYNAPSDWTNLDAAKRVYNREMYR